MITGLVVGGVAIIGLSAALGAAESKEPPGRAERERHEHAQYRAQRARERSARRDRRLTQAHQRAASFQGAGNRGRDAIVGAILGGGAGLVAGTTIGLWDLVADGGGHFWRDLFGGTVAGAGGGAVLGALL